MVGVGGSGKQSLARLAAYISALEVFQITLRKGYGIADLKVSGIVVSWTSAAPISAIIFKSSFLENEKHLYKAFSFYLQQYLF